MNENDEKIQKLLDALRAHDSLLDPILDMISTVEDEKGEFKNGDDAEEAVIKVIRKAGTTMLQKWLEKKSNESTLLASERSDLRPHEKKTLFGVPH